MSAASNCRLIDRWRIVEADLSRSRSRRHGYQVEDAGTAELLDVGTIEIKFASHNGDEAILKARRVTSSTAC